MEFINIHTNFYDLFLSFDWCKKKLFILNCEICFNTAAYNGGGPLK